MAATNERVAVVAVIVSYNRRELLLEAVQAVRDQTVPVAGIVVVDNASTDGSADAVRDVPGSTSSSSTATSAGREASPWGSRTRSPSAAPTGCG
ncbi:hypothetical protein GCM10025866_18100 [Naasia aerilata]|uniref:Glycosyltransferase 2-like domain-containing protein n=1 Tax=Naasia aerilata TaxID=1162966 RepID=A0ABM8GCE6_9MICO|nr:hypothetical protein GCM10025866_18100 [Naasia aerilata]